MNNFIRNVLLLIPVLVLSYFTANYFGSWYNSFHPYYEDSFFNAPKESALLFNGFIFAYLFFFILIFQLFSPRNRRIFVLLLPSVVLLAIDWTHLYLPIILALIALGLAMLLRKIFKISKHTEPSPQ